MAKTFTEKVKKALGEIEYDKRHKEVHAYIQLNALKQVKPSNKEQYAMVKCGLCYKIIELRIPPVRVSK